MLENNISITCINTQETVVLIFLCKVKVKSFISIRPLKGTFERAEGPFEKMFKSFLYLNKTLIQLFGNRLSWYGHVKRKRM